MTPKEILELPIKEHWETITVRQYLKDILHALFREVEGFSGKRPLGNSDWEFDFIRLFIEEGIIEGDIDRNIDEVIEWNADQFDVIINEVISAL